MTTAKPRKKQLVRVVVLPPVYRQRGSGKVRPGSTGVSAANNQSTQRLIRGWSQQYGRPITLAEVQESNRNLAHFFDLIVYTRVSDKEEVLSKDSNI